MSIRSTIEKYQLLRLIKKLLSKYLPLGLKNVLSQALYPTIPQSQQVDNGVSDNTSRHGYEEPQVLTTLEELDEMLHLASVAEDDDTLRSVFTKFRMEFPLDLPADPYSKAYADVQFQLYEYLAGKSYASENEVSTFDVDDAVNCPFPYYTQSPSTVGNQLLAIGHIIKTMNLTSGSKVLEFGPGWGNTTMQLARMGYEVTAVDIEPRFVELLQKRAQQKNLKIDARVGSFDLASETDETWDAILFFECFHHCADHISLIKALDKIVSLGGKVIFAAEPITDAFPMPWGFRMDGESLWAIRANGWCELGFQESYFREVLTIHGWQLTKHVCQDTPWGVVFVATRIE